MTAPTITPLYDIELESLMDDDLACFAGDGPAVARVVVPCGCDNNLCAAHRDVAIKRRAKHIRETPFVSCSEHGVPRINPADIRIYPI